MARPFVVALALITAPLPAAAIVTMDFGTTSLPETPFTVPFFELDNAPLQISATAQANSLFLGQSYALTPASTNPDSLGQIWEYATGAPTAGNLALVGQYGMSGIDADKFQNVASFTAPAPLRPRIAGMLNNTSNGIVSFIFASNINTFSMEILDAGVNHGDGKGGPAQFSFFGRDGTLLQTINWSKAVDGQIVFRSDSIDIAGFQLSQQDPFGLLYQVLKFGVEVPAPAPFAMVGGGLALLGLMRRRRVGGCAESVGGSA